jgi:hypothetical protein
MRVFGFVAMVLVDGISQRAKIHLEVQFQRLASIREEQRD